MEIKKYMTASEHMQRTIELNSLYSSYLQHRKLMEIYKEDHTFRYDTAVYPEHNVIVNGVRVPHPDVTQEFSTIDEIIHNLYKAITDHHENVKIVESDNMLERIQEAMSVMSANIEQNTFDPATVHCLDAMKSKVDWDTSIYVAPYDIDKYSVKK